MARTEEPRQTFRLTVRPEPWSTPVTVRLRRALKVLLRSFGFRVVAVEQVKVSQTADPDQPDATPGQASFGHQEPLAEQG
jgi:hypothetical protein